MVMRRLARRFTQSGSGATARDGEADDTRKPPLRGYGRRAAIVNGLAVLTLLAAPADAQARARIVVLGDSLTAGYGLPKAQAFPARLEAALRQAGIEATVIDAGVSGDTSAGGLARLDWAVGNPAPEFAIVELGANDGLRGLSPQAMEANLDKILGRLAARNVRILLAGMRAPRNLGREYAEEFDGVFARLAQKHGAVLYPFFLDGIATDPALNQGDGIHPNAAGVEEIVRRILPYVKQLVGAG
jgi:acyl-CoA thioesterase-1